MQKNNDIIYSTGIKHKQKKRIIADLLYSWQMMKRFRMKESPAVQPGISTSWPLFFFRVFSTYSSFCVGMKIVV